ncbi:DUF2161 family putative PD-(D/E)XK-type phosphodiesterase [Paenibacillus thiaminolyticus]|nr:DUF2161 family putative PD-(D/E)XK-type phosphodiesterase [Paenibacillus thiaminolyticus]
MEALDHHEAKPARAAARKESELYAPLKEFFEARGYIVRGEVRHCDLVAMRPEDEEGQEEPPIIVELKPSFNLTLVLQALERQKLSPQVYVAVEKKKGGKGHSVSSLRQLCGKLGIGFLLVTFYKRKAPFVEIVCTPAGSAASYMETRPVKTRAARLVREFSARSGDYNVGGTTKLPLVTAYREKALRAAHCLADGPLRAAAVRDGSGVGDAAAILQRNYYGWFERISRGVYALTGEGREALERYAHVVLDWHKPGAGTAEVTGLPLASDT